MNSPQQPGQGRVEVQPSAHRAAQTGNPGSTWSLWDPPVPCGNGQALMEGAVVLPMPFQQLSWAFWVSV